MIDIMGHNVRENEKKNQLITGVSFFWRCLISISLLVPL